MSEQKSEEIRSALNTIPQETLADALSIFLSESSTREKENSQLADTFKNFAQAILFLKKNYHFKELESFSTEADLVYVQTGDRRYLLTDTDITEEDRVERRRLMQEQDSDRNTESDQSDSVPIREGTGRFSHLEF